MKKKGLILVANYNQALEIENYLTQCLAHFTTDQIVVIDDGSNDGSDKIAEKMNLAVLKHSSNLGIGAAIRTGFIEANRRQCDWVLISSSNGKMIPAEFKKVYTPVDDGQVDFVQGSRFLNFDSSQGLPLFRRIMIPIFTSIVRFLLGQRVTDVTCGLRCYNLSLLRDDNLDIMQSWLNRYELEYYLLYKFLRVLKVRWVEVAVTIRYYHLQKNRKSKIVPFTGWWSMIRPFLFLYLGLKK